MKKRYIIMVLALLLKKNSYSLEEAEQQKSSYHRNAHCQSGECPMRAKPSQMEHEERDSERYKDGEESGRRRDHDHKHHHHHKKDEQNLETYEKHHDMEEEESRELNEME
jgi:hypothetical protein